MTRRQLWIRDLCALFLFSTLALPRGGAGQAPPAPAAPPPPPPAAALAPRAQMSPTPPTPPTPAQPPTPPRAPRAPRLSGGYLGVEIVDLTPELRQHFGAPREVGVMVGRVEPGSPAARAGLKVADVVTRIGGEPVHDSWGFSGEVSSRQAREVLSLTLVRDGKERLVEATLEQRERDAVDVGRWIFPPAPSIPGVPPVASAPGRTSFPEVGPALERLGRLLESDDLKGQIRATQLRIDAEVEKRMHELETRLKELERRLQEGDRRR